MIGLLAIFLFALSINSTVASWGSPGLGQYHIQTDEGPERFFRFQTDSGQYRKEKRLQDGTVIGTDAWIDAAGYLRQNDYIADKKGYRILKAKTVFVGHDKSIEDAMKSAKKAPPQSGTLVPHRNSIHKHNHNAAVNQAVNKIVPVTRKPILLHTKTTTTIAPQSSLNVDPFLPPIDPHTLKPSSYLGFDHYPQTPVVDLHHHSQPIDDNHLPDIIVSTTTSQEYPAPTPSPPSIRFQPPFQDFKRIRPIAVINTSPSPISGPQYNIPPTPIPTGYEYSTPTPFSLPTSTPSPFISTTELNGFYNAPPSTTQRPFLATTTRQPIDPLDGNDIDIQPIHNRRPARPYNYRPPPQTFNKLGNVYDPQYAEYNGVAVTRDGFRYYLPRQYHEEENIDDRRKAGSFGYIDPFGIRRVVYYNASPENGFVHRKNNRFVGFNATPYDDPRPQV